MSEPVIRVEGLGKRYRIGRQGPAYRTLRESLAGAVAGVGRRRSADETIWALRDVSFEVHRGEVVGVIGKNGAGKTTLLKVLSRITRPTTGHAEIRGRVGSLLETGTGFHRELTGRENVFLNAAILGMRRAEIQRRLDEIVAFADVGRFLDTELKYYSTGMQVRLAFAVAAHLQPEILLMDEVLAVGDVEFQKKCMGKMEEVIGEGRTVLFVSHSLGAINALCSRAMLLDHGRVVAAGRADAVVARYLGEIHAGAADRVVRPEDHFHPSEHLRVERVQLVGAVADGFCVHWRQPITLSLSIRVLGPLDDVSFGVGVRGVDGSHVLTVHQDDEGDAPFSFVPGRYTIDVTLGNDLRPGFYRIHVGAHRRFYDARHLFAADVGALEVLEYGEDGRGAAPANTGIVNGTSTWKTPVLVAPA